LIFAKKFRYNTNVILHDIKGCAWLLAACHKTTYRVSIILVVQTRIVKINKNPNAYSGITRQPGYPYQMVKRRRRLLTEGKIKP